MVHRQSVATVVSEDVEVETSLDQPLPPESSGIVAPEIIPRFQPIVVRGEPVSTTLLRDRGSI